MADAIDVDAARCQIGGDQHSQRATAELQQGLLTRRLRFVAVNAIGRHARTIQLLCYFIGTVLGACENQHALEIAGDKQFARQGSFIRPIDE